MPLDLFSALIDSRTGGSTLLSQLAREPTWSVSGEAVYSAWDSTNKELQRQCRTWTPCRELSMQALAATYHDLDLPGDPAEDAERLLNPTTVGTSRYRYRGAAIPIPWQATTYPSPADPPGTYGEPVAVKAARRVREAVRRKRAGRKTGTAPRTELHNDHRPHGSLDQAAQDA